MTDIEHTRRQADIRWFATDRLIFTAKSDFATDQALVNRINDALAEFGFKLVDDSELAAQEASADDKSCYSQKFMIAQEETETETEVSSFAIQNTEQANLEVTEAQVFAAVRKLDETIVNNDDNGILAVSPNWLLITSPPEPGAVVGPGARPKKWTEPTEPPYHVRFYPRKGDLTWILGSEARPVSAPPPNPRPVTVVILDTSPDALPPADTGNPLLESLRNKLTLHTDPQIEAQLAPITIDQFPNRDDNWFLHPDGHEYRMESHGLFAAGLIHDIMPQADIHLIRALNRYGVGTLETIRRGIEYALDNEAINTDEPWIINLSLTMTYPYPQLKGGKASDRLDWEDLWKDVAEEQATWRDFLTEQGPSPRASRVPLSNPDGLAHRLRYALEVPLRKAYEQGAVLIAAAGNERRPNQPLPMTMYPAAYDDVIGVGALKEIKVNPDTVETVSYSDFSCAVDKPAEEGFAVLGGNSEGSGLVTALTGEEIMDTKTTDSVIGLWLGKYPEDGPAIAPHNDVSWAHWAGTSFAAPIISGAMAVLLSNGYDRETAVTMLKEGWKEVRNVTSSRQDVPQVVLAKQGDDTSPMQQAT